MKDGEQAPAWGIGYDRPTMVQVLVYHQRVDITCCQCGWGVLGASHAEHVADVYEQAVLSRLGL